MSKKVKVSDIVIQYPDGESKQVSVADARELHKQLDELFGKKNVTMPTAPVIIERDRDGQSHT